MAAHDPQVVEGVRRKPGELVGDAAVLVVVEPQRARIGQAVDRGDEADAGGLGNVHEERQRRLRGGNRLERHGQDAMRDAAAVDEDLDFEGVAPSRGGGGGVVAQGEADAMGAVLEGDDVGAGPEAGTLALAVDRDVDRGMAAGEPDPAGDLDDAACHGLARRVDVHDGLDAGDRRPRRVDADRRAEQGLATGETDVDRRSRR